jgi:putative sigma-54 modulation protein
MQIQTTARHFELDPEDRLFAQERLTKLARFARDLEEAHLVVPAEGTRHSAEITLKLKRHDMVSREESMAARHAIDLAADRLEKQLRRLKDRRVTRKRSVKGLESSNGTSAAADDVEETGEAANQED